jgi:NADPH-dependent ferric siderophore reductase
MTEKPARRVRRAFRGEVRRTERLTPHLIRVTLGGDGLREFRAGEYTDHYVKLQFPAPGAAYPEPFDLEAIRRDLPRDQWPRTRTYTVRAWDPETAELTIDFVYHGDEGVAGPWAAAAVPGDVLWLLGPGGAYAPDPEAPWHLLAGDESALPAIAASLERLPEGAEAHVFVEVAGPEEEIGLATAGDARITWLHRGGGQVGAELVKAVRELEFPPGLPHVFVHGEAGFVKELRRYLRVERGLPLDRLSVSGYWRRGTDEDGWQAGKREWNQRVEAEEAAALAS